MKTIKQAIRILKKCSGDCIHCEHCNIKTAVITDQLTVYAWYCDVADEAGYRRYGEKLRTLRQETLDMLTSE